MLGCSKLQYTLGLSSLALSLWLGSCKTKEKFPELGSKITGATDIATAPSSRYFYVLNSDYERKYNEGSLVVIDPDAAAGSEKVATISTRRLGRSMTVGQGQMVLTYDSPDLKDTGYVEIWSLANETAPVLTQTFDIKCSPIQSAVAPSKPYFAVTCANGDLYMGALGAGTDASLDRVRGYGHEHRALYFYEGASKTYLLGFPSDSDLPEYDDFEAADQKHYVPNADKTQEGTMVDGPNGVPDRFEDTASARRRISGTLPYRMFVFNVTDELAASSGQTDGAKFRTVELGTYSAPTQANNELLYLYYTVRDLSGQTSSGDGTSDLYGRYYRTNFWDVKRALEGSGESFYLSQRGNAYGSASNQVLRLDLDETALDKVGKSEVRFEEIFQVERVYGFALDRDSTGRFPSSFAIAKIEGEPMLIINHFRDLVNFSQAPFYSLTRKFLESPLSADRPSSINSVDFHSSYYQVAVSQSGKVLTSSFYGNALLIFDARPSVDFGAQTPVRIE